MHDTRHAIDRRTFLRRAFGTGAALAYASAAGGASPRAAAQPQAPNILVILVDEMRAPQWFGDWAALRSLLPGIAHLRDGAVRFEQHYTAANACTPARAALLTGLYTHQTACLMTMTQPTTPALDPGFPTWGTLLRKQGYRTAWYGKWHLSRSCDLEPYGFSGGTCPSPNGLPNRGIAKDPDIADQWIAWLDEQADEQPWCSTVSFVNPHDVAFFPRWTDLVETLNPPPAVFDALPPNWETEDDLRAKPSLQRAHQQLSAQIFGYLPFDGPKYERGWIKLLNVYLRLQQYVDAEIARVVAALEARPAVAARTVVIFTADHGDYAGSHGLRGKGDGVYDEGIRVPLLVKDYTGRFAAAPGTAREHLTSSVDVAPLLLSLATGGDGWRADPRYQHLAGRLDLLAMVRDAGAAGRPYVVTTSDEIVIEGGNPDIVPQDVPKHVVGLRTAEGKLGMYSFWHPRTIDPDLARQEWECYDYSTVAGRLETENVAQRAPAFTRRLRDALLDDALPNDLHQPVPSYLEATQRAAFAAYWSALGEQAHVYLPLVARP